MYAKTWLNLAAAESERLYNKPNLTTAELHQLAEWKLLGFSVREAVDLTFMPVPELTDDLVYDPNPVRQLELA